MTNDHDLLIQISTDVRYIKEQLEEEQELLKNHETRLREEEIWTARFKTGIGIIAFAITVLMGLIFRGG